MSVLKFPDGFLWGAATSSHQVEGGQDNDWSEWEKKGKIADGTVSGRAGDHWNRYKADFDIAKSLGHTAHRLSIEWSRIEPHQGTWDETAIAHYRDVINALRERGMEPFVTLWHFTSPRWFMERGGWEAHDAPELFARYAAKIAEALFGVTYWMTLNEANVYTLFGYVTGEWPPEVRNPWRAYRVFRNLAHGHNAAARAMRAIRPDLKIGSAHNVVPHQPVRPERSLDRWSSRTADQWYNRKWLDWTAKECDFFGINTYFRLFMRFASPWQPFAPAPMPKPHSDFGWEMYPHELFLALRLAGTYGKPLYVTENGVADAQDRWREEFIKGSLKELHSAISSGVDVRGYLHWSLLDNFEWREGFSKRFGLVAVDYTTMERTVRESARRFATVCKKNQLEA